VVADERAIIAQRAFYIGRSLTPKMRQIITLRLRRLKKLPTIVRWSERLFPRGQLVMNQLNRRMRLKESRLGGLQERVLLKLQSCKNCACATLQASEDKVCGSTSGLTRYSTAFSSATLRSRDKRLNCPHSLMRKLCGM
jgi:hypothetical protein